MQAVQRLAPLGFLIDPCKECGSRLGYMDFKFISLSLAIVRIDCTIVRVIEPQRLWVVLHNRISKDYI
jgi:hypothetical protein